MSRKKKGSAKGRVIQASLPRDLSFKEEIAEYERNKRKVLSGETFRSRRDSGYRVGKAPGSYKPPV